MSVDSGLFSQTVLCWFAKHRRDFPWRNTHNPYFIFLAEVLLRRTQAERVVETYAKLTEKYPTPQILAQANVQELRVVFQPLGLTRKADLLVQAAKSIVKEHEGQFPQSVSEISTLPGMGIYGSRAVACLAFGERVPMIDESVGRLLRRVLNLKEKKPAYSDKQLIKDVMQIIPINFTREFNLGLLDIAAAFCHHKVPSCLDCPLNRMCAFHRSLGRLFFGVR